MQLPTSQADQWLDVYQQNALTRVAGGRAAGGGKQQPKRLVVDMREFMSSLPAVLHQQVRCWRGLGSPGIVM